VVGYNYRVTLTVKFGPPTAHLLEQPRVASSATKHGTIDLHGLFEAAAQGLLLSVEQGRLLHKTKNIRDAGSPFETAFRAFLNARLPATFSVTGGYLFDPNSNCTPQIDAIVVDGRESHELLRSDDGAAYVPYPSGRTLIELKNSSKGLAVHVKQVRAVVKAVEEMRNDAQTVRRQSSGPYLDRPLTVLVIGDSSKASLKSFKALYKPGMSDPSYTLLLDKGLIIAAYNPGSPTLRYDDRDGINKPLALDWYSYRQWGVWGIWEPESPGAGSGHALLWLYFAIVAQLNLAANGNQGTILGFTNQVSRDFPMVLKSDLQSAKDW
jgi:hypothetical protein